MPSEDYLTFNKPASNSRDGPSYYKNMPPTLLKQLNELVHESQTVILNISAFPLFDIFPDRLIVDESKVNIIYRYFWGSETIDSVLIENISDVTIEAGLLLATLRITNSSNVRFPVIMTISNLRKHDAFRARRIIQGLISAHKHGINLSQYSISEVKDYLEKLGEAKED